MSNSEDGDPQASAAGHPDGDPAAPGTSGGAPADSTPGVPGAGVWPGATPAPPAQPAWPAAWEYPPPAGAPHHGYGFGYGYGGWGPGWDVAPGFPPPQPAPRRSRPMVAVLVAAALVLTAGGVGAVLRTLDGAGILPGSGADLTSQETAGVVDINTTLDGGGEAAGTGMVLTASGEVLTNNHVVEGATSMSVLIGGVGTAHPAHVVGTDATHDVALIQVEGVSGLTPVSLGHSSSLHVGDAVTAVGNALGREGPPTVTQGSVTALDQTITAGGGSTAPETLEGLIEIDARVLPGDSGGPLLDAADHVVGMDTAAAFSRRRVTTGNVAYAIPIDDAMAIVAQIRAGGAGASGSGGIQVGQRPLLGVHVQDASSAADAPVSSGALVVGVQSGGPADGAGISQGDVIVGVGGTQVDSVQALTAAVGSHRVGDRVDVEWVDASGTHHHATVRLVAAPPA